MENQNVCINSHGQSREHCLIQGDVTDLPCTFSRVKKDGQPALLAKAHVQVDDVSIDFLSALRLHVSELNVRLPVLNVTVSSLQGNRCCFVLQGLNSGDITPDNMRSFLALLSQDIKAFSAYLRLHNVVSTLS